MSYPPSQAGGCPTCLAWMSGRGLLHRQTAGRMGGSWVARSPRSPSRSPPSSRMPVGGSGSGSQGSRLGCCPRRSSLKLESQDVQRD